MIFARFDTEALTRVRFAVSPMLETIRSVCALDDPAARALHLPWAEQARPKTEDLDLSLLFLDLDYFKHVNDTHGHLAGSQVLREVGRLLRKHVGETESIAARYGGDEFVLALPGVGLSGAVTHAEQIRKAIVGSVYCAEPGEIQLEPLNLTGLTCSIGVATLKRHLQRGMSLEHSKSALLRLADTAMYIAKETGRNQTAVAGKPVRRDVEAPVVERR